MRFHSNSGYANAPHSYSIHILPVFLNYDVMYFGRSASYKRFVVTSQPESWKNWFWRNVGVYVPNKWRHIQNRVIWTPSGCLGKTPQEHTCISLQYTCISLQHTCISLQHTSISLQHTCISLQHTCISLQHTYISLQHTYISLQHTCISLQHTCISLQHTCNSLQLLYPFFTFEIRSLAPTKKKTSY